MKFLRHLGAVVLVVAVIVGLGLLWAHVSGGGTGGDIMHAASPQALPRPEHVKGGVVEIVPGAAYGPPPGFRLTSFDLTNTGVLYQTGEIEAALAAAVITVTAFQRRSRRKRRAAAS